MYGGKGFREGGKDMYKRSKNIKEEEKATHTNNYYK